MPGTLPGRGNLIYSFAIGPTLTPASVAANITAEQSFTVPGLQTGDIVQVSKPTVQAGLIVAGARVATANTLGLTFGNLTATAITPTAGEIYSIEVNRPEVAPLPVNAI